MQPWLGQYLWKNPGDHTSRNADVVRSTARESLGLKLAEAPGLIQIGAPALGVNQIGAPIPVGHVSMPSGSNLSERCLKL